MTLTLEQVTALRQIVQKATPAPWVHRHDEPADLWSADGKDALVCVQTSYADVRFIQAMREYAEPLVEAAWNLAAELPAAWREDLDSLQACLERVGQERDEAWAEVKRLQEEVRAMRSHLICPYYATGRHYCEGCGDLGEVPPHHPV